MSEHGGNGRVVLKSVGRLYYRVCAPLFTPPPSLLTPCFWPNRDAAAVCSGKKMEEHHVFDAKTELALTKGIEMVCESIPGCLLQLYVIFKVGDTVTSVVVSALTTGY